MAGQAVKVKTQTLVTGTSNNGHSRRPGSRGFTLIEVLVVVVIVGVISSVVLLSAGLIGTDRELQKDTRRMSSLIELAADEAVLQGRDLGLEILRNGYRFVEFDPYLDQWHEVAGDELLRPRELADDHRFELYIEDRAVTLNETAAETAVDEDRQASPNTANYAPHVLIMSSGQLTPADLLIVRDRDRSSMQLTIDAAGEIKVGSEDDDEF